MILNNLKKRLTAKVAQSMTEGVYFLTPISGIQVLKFTNMELMHFCHEF